LWLFTAKSVTFNWQNSWAFIENSVTFNWQKSWAFTTNSVTFNWQKSWAFTTSSGNRFNNQNRGRLQQAHAIDLKQIRGRFISNSVNRFKGKNVDISTTISVNF